MSCLPTTPTTNNVLTDIVASNTDGWLNVPSVSTSALSAYFPVQSAPSVLTFNGVFQTSYQHGRVVQLQIEETATSSANIRKTALQVYLYTGAAPTTPTAGAVYNGSPSNLLAIVEIAAGDYKRLSDTVWLATVAPNIYVRTGSTASSSNVYAVVLANEGKTYAASAALRARLFTEQSTALA
jgi:hypothetical protein